MLTLTIKKILRPVVSVATPGIVLAFALVTAGAIAQVLPPEAQALIAFRLDAASLVAVLKVIDEPPLTSGQGPEPLARFGFKPVVPPSSWLERNPVDSRPGDRWVIHAAAGQDFPATAERVVSGTLGCESTLGVLLRVSPERAQAFAALSAKYVLAERAVTGAALLQSDQPALPGNANAIGAIATPSTPAFRRALETTLTGILTRELPNVRAEGAGEIARFAASSVDDHRSWARNRQIVDAGLDAGKGRLMYDTQSFHLSPDGVPVHFVRARWLVGQEQGFAVSVWVRGDATLEVIQTNLRPASWLRMFEFEGVVSTENLGLILNVIDRNRDGWGEVIVFDGGYEGFALSTLEYSSTGFQPVGTGYAGGC